MVPEVAVIDDVPAPVVVTIPFAELMVATEVFEEFQVTNVVMFWVELSEYVPVAVNCRVVPGAITLLAGETEIEVSVFEELLPPPPPQLASTIIFKSNKAIIFFMVPSCLQKLPL